MSPVDLCKRTSGMVPGALLLHCHSMKSAIVGEKWYLVGRYETSGTSKAPAPATYCVSLPKLCAFATKSQVTSAVEIPRCRVFVLFSCQHQWFFVCHWWKVFKCRDNRFRL